MSRLSFSRHFGKQRCDTKEAHEFESRRVLDNDLNRRKCNGFTPITSATIKSLVRSTYMYLFVFVVSKIGAGGFLYRKNGQLA
jgi:hypothetical protein